LDYWSLHHANDSFINTTIERLIDHSSENCDEHFGCLLVTDKNCPATTEHSVETTNLLLRFSRPNNGEKHVLNNLLWIFSASKRKSA